MKMDMPRQDKYGNQIEAALGYARGRILSSSVQDAQRLKHCQTLAANHVRRAGMHSLGVFTGNCRDYPLLPEDLGGMAEEWVGTSLYYDQIHKACLSHLGARDHHATAFFNRTSAGIVATVRALSASRAVLSFVPKAGRSHASLRRGSLISQVALHEFDSLQELALALHTYQPALMVITTVTSELQLLSDEDIQAAIQMAQAQGAVTLLDEAYGARVRPVLAGGKLSLELGAELSISNSDKAGMCGPRAGMMAGEPELIARVQASAFELGLEARAPVIAGIFRALQNYLPSSLEQEAKEANLLLEALSRRLPELAIETTLLGALISENAMFDYACQHAGLTPQECALVPYELSALVGVLMLQNHRMLTTNTHGHTGASAALRLKPIHSAIERCGGISTVVTAVESSLQQASMYLQRLDLASEILLGHSTNN